MSVDATVNDLLRTLAAEQHRSISKVAGDLIQEGLRSYGTVTPYAWTVPTKVATKCPHPRHLTMGPRRA